MDAWDRVLQEPGDVPILETEWLQHLVYLIRGAAGYVQQLKQWQNHLENICNNLRLTEKQIEAVLDHSASILPFMEDQKLDTDYLRWVVSDALTELTILVDQTEELARNAPRMVEAIEVLECEHLKSVPVILTALSQDSRQSFYRAFSQTLTNAYDTKDPHQIQQAIAKYFDLFAVIRATQPLLISSDDTPIKVNGPQLEQRIDLFAPIEEWGLKLSELLTLRAKVYDLFVKHEICILTTVVPKDTDIAGWRREFFTHPEPDVVNSFPDTIDFGLLRLGIRQSQEYLSELNQSIKTVQTIFSDDAFLKPLLEYLRSQPLTKFYNAESKRVEVFLHYSTIFQDKLKEMDDFLQTSS